MYYSMYSPRIQTAAAICARSLSDAGLSVCAMIWETDRVVDIATSPSERPNLIVRCVARVEASDYVALATMVAEGDCERAAVVYCDGEPPNLSNAVKSWPIENAEAMAAALARGIVTS